MIGKKVCVLTLSILLLFGVYSFAKRILLIDFLKSEGMEILYISTHEKTAVGSKVAIVK